MNAIEKMKAMQADLDLLENACLQLCSPKDLDSIDRLSECIAAVLEAYMESCKDDKETNTSLVILLCLCFASQAMMNSITNANDRIEGRN